MARVAAGEAAALEELVRRYERPLSAYLHRRTDGRDVEDLYQETWMRVVRAATRFDVSRRFSTWLFQIATNLCRDWYRRRARERTEGDVDEQPSPSPGRVDAALTARTLLGRLPDAQRETLVLRYYHDMSDAEISEILGCPPGTVKSRVHNAIARLASLLREEP